MNEIEIWNGSTKALIDPIGAWLANLSDDYGDILHPRRTLTTATGERKIRGGSHVCLPNFGPGGDSGLSQHGFGREMTWAITDKQWSEATLELPQGQGEYQALYSTLVYRLGESSITMTLTLMNNGDTPLRVAPGFHPYFVLDRNEARVTLNDAAYDTQDLADTEFFDHKNIMNLKLQRRAIEITSENLPTWAFWTDQLGEYVCVEPTVGGYTFLENPADNELLAPKSTQSYSVSIAW